MMRVLLIEDNDSDALLIRQKLSHANATLQLTHVTRLNEGLAIAQSDGFDVILLDLLLPDSSGYQTFLSARTRVPTVPIIILTGLDDRELALRAVADGAQDYLPKDALAADTLLRSIQYAVERKRADVALRESQERYRLLFESIPTPVIVYDWSSLAILDVNTAAVKLYGWTRAEFETLTTVDIRPPEEVPAFLVKVRQLGPELEFAGNWRHRKKDGTPIEVEILTRSLVMDGKPVRLAMMTDVTERARARESLANSERLARATVNALTAQIAILDETGRIISVNDAWDHFGESNGAGAKGKVGANYLEVCSRAAGPACEGAAQAADGIRRVLRGELKTFYHEYPCHSPQEQRWFAMRVTRFPEDGPVRVVVAHENITERKRAEALDREHAGLHDAMRAMDQVLGVVGHELRTPLAGLRAMVEFLLNPETRQAPEWEKFLTAINDEVVQMSDMVDNLLETARLNSGRARWNWSTFDLNTVCKEAIESMRPLIDPSRVELTCRIEPPDARMNGDATALRRLIVNLVSNARKHTGSGRIDLQARVRGDGQWLELKVSDTGEGIEPAILSRLGEAFALNSGVVGANHISGTGLGLAICKGIAAAHAGRLSIHSTLGQGTTVVAMLRTDLPDAASTESPTPIRIAHDPAPFN